MFECDGLVTMPYPSLHFADRFSTSRILLERVTAFVSFILFILFFMHAPTALGQVSDANGSTQVLSLGSAETSASSQSNAQGDVGTEGQNRDSPLGGTSLAPSPALSADQIEDILEQNPDLLEELKEQLTEHLNQQGIQVSPDDISDQMIYNQIASNPGFRANITTVLQARGYDISNELLLAQSSTDDFAPVSPSIALGSEESGTLINANPVGTPRNNAGIPSSFARGNTSPRTFRINPRAQEKSNASTDAPAVLHEPTPLDLQSMRDLYAQIPNDTLKLQRFGSDVFMNRSAAAAARSASNLGSPLDVPLGPEYVVGAGDKLTIDLWGSSTQSITRTIDRDGRIFLPEAGVVEIAGLELDKAQGLIASALKQQFRNAQIAVTVSGLHSVRVYVVGDVQRPGGYDLSSLATPLSALYAAGGPTAVGSLRVLHHYRGKQLVEDIDLYDFLLHGVRSATARFESGDTLLVPPAGPQIAISGSVKRPAIYELKSGETELSTVIDDAGGFTAAASLSHIRIERIDDDHQRVTVTLPDGGRHGTQEENDAIARFEVKDGDRIRVEPILPYSQRAVYLAGHVVRPGRLPYSDGMRLSDVIRSYQDLLPEPAAHGEIVRLIPPDLHAETIDFNVPDVLIGNSNIDLQPFDTICIFGRYEADAPTVTILGEVLRPGKYPMSKGMTAAQLVRLAGGFKRDALVDTADLTSYHVSDGDRVAESLAAVRIGAAVEGSDPRADVLLKPGDILAIHQITNWNNIGESVTIDGEVKYPGSYGFQDGEHLSSVLRRAGGFLPAAYPMGAVLIREQVKSLEQSSRDELIRQIETNAAAARLSPNLSASNSAGMLELVKAQQDQIIADLRSHPPTGRMVIHISADIDSWANTPVDIELRRNDVLTIPKRPGFVLVTGQVYNPTALTFTPGKSAGWYLGRAGGTNATANRKEIFVIRANGSVVGRRSGGPFASNVLETKLNPGDAVVVPQKIVGGSLLWRNLLSTGQILSSAALTAGVAAATL